MSQRIISLLTELITFRTLPEDHATNQRALTWIQKQLNPHMHSKIVINGGFPSLVATTLPGKAPKLWLQAHLDIVPGSDEAFSMREDGDKLIGRGVFDMKYAIASYIELTQTLGDMISDYDFGVMITTDEEIGGANGVKALLAEGYTSQAVFLPDGGKDWQYVSASRGIWHLEAVYHGESNHGSRPWLGDNAVLGLMKFTEELMQFFPKEPCHIKDHFHSTANVGVFTGGVATNQIPDVAQAQYDIRYTVEDSKALKLYIEQLLKKHPQVSITTIAEGSGYKVNPDEPFFKLYDTILRQHGVTPSFGITHGSSDARYFMEHGIPAIVLRPHGGGHHSEFEWMSKSGFETFDAVLEAFVKKASKK